MDEEMDQADLLQSGRHRQVGMCARPKNGVRPIHPGEVLREDFLAPIGMTTNALASTLRVALSKIDDVVNERREVDAELALRLARYFGGGAESWLNLQQAYELKLAQRAHGSLIEAEITPREGSGESILT